MQVNSLKPYELVFCFNSISTIDAWVIQFRAILATWLEENNVRHTDYKFLDMKYYQRKSSGDFSYNIVSKIPIFFLVVSKDWDVHRCIEKLGLCDFFDVNLSCHLIILEYNDQVRHLSPYCRLHSKVIDVRAQYSLWRGGRCICKKPEEIEDEFYAELAEGVACRMGKLNHRVWSDFCEPFKKDNLHV